MKDILKMLQFDYIIVEKLTAPYVIGFIALCLVLALFGVPLGVFGFAATLCLFAPLEMVFDSDAKRIYGLLPVHRTTVVRADFTETAGAMFAGEIFSLVCLFISRYTKLYHILPQNIDHFISRFFDPGKNGIGLDFGQVCFALVYIFCGLFLLLGYLKMIEAIHGQENAVKHLLVIFAVMAAAITLLFYKRKLPDVENLIPSTVMGKLIFAVILNIAVLGLYVFFCEHTVRKTQCREL